MNSLIKKDLVQKGVKEFRLIFDIVGIKNYDNKTYFSSSVNAS